MHLFHQGHEMLLLKMIDPKCFSCHLVISREMLWLLIIGKNKKKAFPTNTPHVFYVEKMSKWSLPDRFNVDYTRCVCRVWNIRKALQKSLRCSIQKRISKVHNIFNTLQNGGRNHLQIFLLILSEFKQIN